MSSVPLKYNWSVTIPLSSFLILFIVRHHTCGIRSEQCTNCSIAASKEVRGSSQYHDWMNLRARGREGATSDANVSCARSILSLRRARDTGCSGCGCDCGSKGVICRHLSRSVTATRRKPMQCRASLSRHLSSLALRAKPSRSRARDVHYSAQPPGCMPGC